MNEASFTGFFRTVLTLVVAWFIIRLLIRLFVVYQASQRARGPFQQAPPDLRPKGDVRIERPDKNNPRNTGGTIEDADYEEVK